MIAGCREAPGGGREKCQTQRPLMWRLNCPIVEAFSEEKAISGRPCREALKATWSRSAGRAAVEFEGEMLGGSGRLLFPRLAETSEQRWQRRFRRYEECLLANEICHFGRRSTTMRSPRRRS